MSHLHLLKSKTATAILVAVHVLILASVTSFFQNCSPARFSIAGSEKGGDNISQDIPPTDEPPITPDDPQDPPDDGPPEDVADCSVGGQYEECGSELIDNGDFEVVDSRVGLTNGVALNALADGKLWDVFASLPGQDCDVSWYAEDGTSGIEIQSGGVVAAASGKHLVELDSHSNTARGGKTNSGMYQVLNVKYSAKYCVSFQYRGRVQTADDNRIDVFVGNSKIRSVADVPSSTWQKVKVVVPINKGLNKILFRASGAQNTYGGLLDSVSIRKLCLKK
ncbi:MAG: hypothetical protein AB7N80_12825 [Bdellovibrionales bacterium]